MSSAYPTATINLPLDNVHGPFSRRKPYNPGRDSFGQLGGDCPFELRLQILEVLRWRLLCVVLR